MYGPPPEVLKTLYRDRTTWRIRDLKPRDDVDSLYDELCAPTTRFVFAKTELANFMARAPIDAATLPRQLWYNEADALEDQILFPEEFTANGIDPLKVGKLEPLPKWEEEGFSFKKFVENQVYGSDSEFTDDSDEDEESWGSESDVEDDDEIIERERLENSADEDDDEDETPDPELEENIMKVWDDIIAKEYPGGISDLMKKVRARRHALPERDPGSDHVMHEDFMSFLEKEKSISKHYPEILPHTN
jgi:hypothetical protein